MYRLISLRSLLTLPVFIRSCFLASILIYTVPGLALELQQPSGAAGERRLAALVTPDSEGSSSLGVSATS